MESCIIAQRNDEDVYADMEPEYSKWKNKDQKGIYSMQFLHKKLKKISVYMYDVYIFKNKLWKDKPKTKESSYL